MSRGSYKANKDDLLVDWEIFCPIGPKLAFHVACVIGNIKNLSIEYFISNGMVEIMTDWIGI